ncbi:MAG: hypothetical protein KGZ69_15975 [Methylomonas sp.]|nr:hypothetical protein [Methylomonas sp.]
MPFVLRDENGDICGLFAVHQEATEEFLDDGDPEVVAFRKPGYQELRRQSYPSIGDQLDAIWKKIQSTGDAGADQMFAEINAVKSKYPKP